jgi:hypothetical protein
MLLVKSYRNLMISKDIVDERIIKKIDPIIINRI